ncbi:hypothetical protein A0256_09005 [Mucilaginibacter sp. PAMC 26640]|nr:hypothetical protein A0256_09005 [Mucilaginibacter sp. PAMC 26640]
MKRWLIPLGILFVLALTALIPIRQTSQLIINSSYYNVYQNLATATGWVKWFPYFKSNAAVISRDKGGFKITNALSAVVLKQIGLGAFQIEVTLGNNIVQYDCSVTASDTMGVAKLNVSRRTGLLKYLWLYVKDFNDDTFAYNLKNYLEDPLQYYGFAIKNQVVENKVMMVIRQKSARNNICQDNLAAFRYLLNFSTSEKLKITGPVELQYVASMSDSAEVMIGLPVAKKLPQAIRIQYMDTYGGKVLVGYFKGKYKDRQKLYAAMNLYLADHYLHEQTKPLEKFSNNQLPDKDESTVDLQIIIPYV